MNQQTANNPSDSGIVGSLVGLGAEWAVFGLRCATSALEQSSRSMRLAAKSLATLAREVEARIPAEPEEGNAVETVEVVETVATVEPTVTADPSQL